MIEDNVMKKATKVYIGLFDTFRESFTSIADSDEAARKQIKRAWAAHCALYPGRRPATIEDSDINVIEAEIGDTYMDYSKVN
jgi:hypothetical protein